MSNEITLFDKDKFDQAVKIAQTLAKSKMVPASIQGKPEDIFAILVMGSEIGIPPMTALQSIDVIQGKPTVKPQLMIGLVKSKLPGAIIDIKEDEATQSVTCTAARSIQDYQNNLYYKCTWDMDRAERMGLTMKDNYKKQARTMLKWRAVGEACRTQFADIVMGLYVDEEFKDFDGKVIEQEKTVKDMIDEDFPIPPEEKEVGDLYRIQNGKFRSKQLKDLSFDEIGEYREELIKRKVKKNWESDLINVFTQYLSMIEGMTIEAEAEVVE